MGLSHLLARLNMDVRANRYDRTFSNAQVTDPALGNYLTMGEVLHSLEETAQETYQTREGVIRALVRRHQRDASGYWASVLLVVFAPMLVSLRARLRGSAFESSELDQIVVEGFLLAIAVQETHRDCDRIAMRLRQRTRAFVFGRLVAEQQVIRRQRALERYAKALTFFELFASPTPIRLSDDERQELTELLRTVAADALPQEKLDVVVATRFHGMTLRAYLMGDSELAEDVEVALGRLKREHSRTLVKLRELLERRLASSEVEDSLELGIAQAS